VQEDARADRPLPDAGGRGADPRHRAREAALQMLYQWEVGGAALDEVIESYERVRAVPLDEPGRALAAMLVTGPATRLDHIDPLIEGQSEHWRLERMATVDRLILRMAVFELLETPATPRSVVIDEALELARTFSTEAAVKFVNGVLDGICRRLPAPSGAA
jgi:N utilization substance protein B